MRLRQLLDSGVIVHGFTLESDPRHDPEILSLTADSREVRAGALFAALAGSRTDGRRFIDQALAKGAAAILADPSLRGRKLGVPLILDSDPRRRLALIAARFFQRQPKHVVAVTGTNGKTSVASFVRQLWQALGRPAASLGTLGLDAPGFEAGGGLTTPDPIELQRMLATLADAGIDHLALEASSHGLDQRRLDGVVLEAAAFTNLSRDHFDYHGTIDAYFAAKARLFAELLPRDGTAVLNQDMPEFETLAATCRDRDIRIIGYGQAGGQVRLVRREVLPDGQRLEIAIDGRVFAVTTRLVGAFQAANLLAALGLALATTDTAPDRLVKALGAIEGAPGRLQRVEGSLPGVSVFVDFAHTPDALAHVLDALRPHTQGRLMVVFGCGGDRDPGKRPEMGRIAHERADRVFITDDNPRSEEPASIRRSILDACPGATEIADRGEAIHLAVSKLGVGDMLVVAGKGHETGQIVGTSILPFDDVAVVKAALAEVNGGRSPGPGTKPAAPLRRGNEP